MLTTFVDNFQIIKNLKKKILNQLRNVNFICFCIREAHVQDMENFTITVKRKHILQSAVALKKLTMFINIRIVLNLIIAKFLKMNLYL